MELLAAFASHGTEYITSHARRMNSHKHRLAVRNVSYDKSDMFEPVIFLTERNQTEMPVGCRKIHLFSTFHKSVVFQPVFYQIADTY